VVNICFDGQIRHKKHKKAVIGRVNLNFKFSNDLHFIKESKYQAILQFYDENVVK